MAQKRTNLALHATLIALVLAAGAVVLFGLVATTLAQGTTINVTTTDDELNDDGDCSLREAVQAANTNSAVDACPAGSAGSDTINLPAATYALSITSTSEDANQDGDLDITDNLVMVGEGTAQTILDGGSIDRVVHIAEGVTANISKLTVQNGAIDTQQQDTHAGGGGILNQGTTTLQNVTVQQNNNTARYQRGGGIFNAPTGNLTIESSTITKNTVETQGGGIANTGTLKLVGTTVSENQSTNNVAGGIYNGSVCAQKGSCDALATVDISSKSTISNNTARTYCGGIYNGSELTMSDSSVTGNTATDKHGGGICSVVNGDMLSKDRAWTEGTNEMMVIRDSTIRNNSARQHGGGILTRTNLELTGSTMTENTSGYDGGAISSNGTTVIHDSTIRSNTASGDYGGGIDNWGTLEIATTTIEANSAKKYGGGIFVREDATLKVTECTIKTNSTSKHGGGIYAAKNTTLELTGSTIATNTANDHGGGLFIGGTAQIADTTITENTANKNGGGIHTGRNSSLEVTGSTISQNSANNGGGVWGNAPMDVHESTINGNTARYGGGLYLNSKDIQLTNVTISDNTADREGGGVLVKNGSSSLLNVTISHNSALEKGGNIFNQGNLTLKNSIVANSTSGGDCHNTVTSRGYNLDSDGSCGFNRVTDREPADPLLGELQDNGGPTFTRALQEGSPAIDVGDNTACPVRDQRGFARGVDGDGNSSQRCDIGAFEYGSSADTAVLDPLPEIDPNEDNPPLNAEIYLMNPDGSEVVRITNSLGDDALPVWSPDGKRIAFTSNRDGNSEIYVMDADGSNLQRLTDNPAADYGPVWSPDGNAIAFRTKRDGDYEVYRMNADGSEQINLSNTHGGGLFWFGGNDDAPVDWSPDGKYIIFVSDRTPLGDIELFVMNADGSGQRRLVEAEGAINYASWSSDGQRIVYDAVHADDGNPSGNENQLAWVHDTEWRTKNRELVVMNADGSEQTRLTYSAAADFKPDWSPDGSQIVFVSYRDDNREIYIMNADGSEQTNVSNYASDDSDPDWSPDGSRIAFSSNRPRPAAQPPTTTPEPATITLTPTAPHTPTRTPTPTSTPMLATTTTLTVTHTPTPTPTTTPTLTATPTTAPTSDLGSEPNKITVTPTPTPEPGLSGTYLPIIGNKLTATPNANPTSKPGMVNVGTSYGR